MKSCNRCRERDAAKRKSTRKEKKEGIVYKTDRFEDKLDISLNETVDKNKLAYIIENIDKYDIGECYVNGKKVGGNAQKTILIKYLNGMNGYGKCMVNYKQRNGFGRYWVSSTIGIQNLSKKVRHTICEETMIDIDMKNAHPVLLSSYCEKNGIPCDGLNYYIENRDECLKELVSVTIMNKDEAKQEMLAILNGGALRNSAEVAKYPVWFQNYYNGARLIIEKVSVLEPRMYQLASESKKRNKKEGYNVGGTCLNYVMCCLENKALMIMYKELTDGGAVVSSLVFDGLMVYKSELVNRNIDSLLLKCEQTILKVMGCKIEILVKPMKHALDMSDMGDYKAGLSPVVDSTLTDKLFDMPHSDYIRTVDVGAEVEYVKDLEFPIGYNCIAIKSSLGSGKTTSICRYIKDNDVKRVLVLSPRQSFASSITHEYNTKIGGVEFANYMNIDKKKMGDYDRLVCSMESLHYIINDVAEKPFDLLVVDESQANLTSHVCCATNFSHHTDNVEVFHLLLRKSKQMVFADAFLGAITTEFLSKAEVNTYVYNYKRKMKPRKAIEVVGDDPDILLPHILASLSSGKKVFVYVSSKKRLNKWVKTIRRDIPEKKIKSYISGEGGKIKNVREEWSGVDIVLTTSTITVGINYDIKDVFNTVYINASAMAGNLVSDIFQSHYRIRHLIDDTVYFHLNETTNEGGTLDYEEIVQVLDDNDKRLVAEDHFYIWSPSEIKVVVALNILEQRLSRRELRATFFRYLNECGYSIEVEGGITNDVEIDDEEEEEEFTWAQIPLLGDGDYKDLTKRIQAGEKITTLEKMSLKKYNFAWIFTGGINIDQWITGDDVEGIWEGYVGGLKEVVVSLKHLTSILLGNTSYAQLSEKSARVCNIPALASRKILNRIPSCLGIIAALGVESFVDSETVIEHSRINAIHDEIKADYGGYAKKNDIKDRRKNKDFVREKDSISLVNNILTKNASTKLAAIGNRRERVGNGERVATSQRDYKIVANDKKGISEGFGMKVVNEFTKSIEGRVARRLLVPRADPIVHEMGNLEKPLDCTNIVPNIEF